MVKESFTLRLAEQNIRVIPLFDDIVRMCRDYVSDEPANWTVQIAWQDIEYEREKMRHSSATSNLPANAFSDGYLETLAIYRRIAEAMPRYNTMLIHGSAIAVDGQAYLFTAESGTGKSTHTRLWQERFGTRAVMVNDYKPLVQITNSGAFICGTPWDGKHNRNNNFAAPLKAVISLRRGAVNHIEEVPAKSFYPLLIQQTYHTKAPLQTEKTRQLTDLLMKQAKLYSLTCNMDSEAAQVAYDGMNTAKRE